MSKSEQSLKKLGGPASFGNHFYVVAQRDGFTWFTNNIAFEAAITAAFQLEIWLLSMSLVTRTAAVILSFSCI